MKSDYEILSEKFEVDRYQFKAIKNLFPFLFQFIKQFVFLIVKGWRYDAFFIWFADYHSFLPVLFSRIIKRRSYLVSGGYDATSVPELRYGLFYKKNLRSFMGKKSYKYCSMILPVDKSLIENTNTYCSKDLFQAGVTSFCKVPKSKFRTIATGYDPGKWKEIPDVTRKNSIVSVGSISDLTRWRLKGGDLLVMVAALLPKHDFYFYGIHDHFKVYLEQNGIPQNFHIRGFVDHETLPEIYSAHHVYAQFSMTEGLPNTLCEAMLCGCIPVGSNVNGIPQAIGDAEFILKKQDSIEAAKLIVKALSCNDHIAPRERIVNLFDINRRRTKIWELVESFK